MKMRKEGMADILHPVYEYVKEKHGAEVIITRCLSHSKEGEAERKYSEIVRPLPILSTSLSRY